MMMMMMMMTIIIIISPVHTATRILVRSTTGPGAHAVPMQWIVTQEPAMSAPGELKEG